MRSLMVVALAAILATATGPAAPGVPASAAGSPMIAAAGSRPDVTRAVLAALKKAAAASRKDPLRAVDDAERAMAGYMRTAGGASAALGAGATAVFATIDAAERQVVGQAAADLKAEATAPIAAASLAAATAPGALATGTVGGLLATGSGLFANAPRDDAGRAALPPVAKDETLENGATVHLTMRPTLAGSKVDSAVEVTIAVPGPPAYEERASGRMRVDLCPDAKGNVPVRITLKGGFSLNGGGSSWNLDIRATGHVGDNGRLATFDVQVTEGMAVTPAAGAAGGPVGQFVEAKVRYTGDGRGGVDPRSIVATASRWSSKADQAFADATAEFATGISHAIAFLGLRSAEDQWTGGYCVVIAVPEVTETRRESDAAGYTIELPYKEVDAGTKTPFTAVVRHRWEGKELHVPVTATLTSGKVSVKPSGTAVRAPARFTYTAPDKRGDAYVRLETKSRHGIATLTVVFATRALAWKVRGGYRDWEGYWLTACILDLEQPFTLHAQQGEGAGYDAGTFTLTPTGSAGGTWAFEGLTGGYIYTGSSVYSLRWDSSIVTQETWPVLVMDPGSNWMIHDLPEVGTIPLWNGREFGTNPHDIALEATQECP